jgi:hypothetical protein
MFSSQFSIGRRRRQCRPHRKWRSRSTGVTFRTEGRLSAGVRPVDRSTCNQLTSTCCFESMFNIIVRRFHGNWTLLKPNLSSIEYSVSGQLTNMLMVSYWIGSIYHQTWWQLSWDSKSSTGKGGRICVFVSRGSNGFVDLFRRHVMQTITAGHSLMCEVFPSKPTHLFDSGGKQSGFPQLSGPSVGVASLPWYLNNAEVATFLVFSTLAGQVKHPLLNR